MRRPAFVTYEPSVVEAFPPQLFADLASDEFDEALAHVAASDTTKRDGPGRAQARAHDQKPRATPDSTAPAVVAAGAIATAGYRFVLNPPDDSRLRPWWYARFPKG
jgi:hypothetical protein